MHDQHDDDHDHRDRATDLDRLSVIGGRRPPRPAAASGRATTTARRSAGDAGPSLLRCPMARRLPRRRTTSSHSLRDEERPSMTAGEAVSASAQALVQDGLLIGPSRCPAGAGTGIAHVEKRRHATPVRRQTARRTEAQATRQLPEAGRAVATPRRPDDCRITTACPRSSDERPGERRRLDQARPSSATACSAASAAGGFGTVWRAHDERLDREVAVKIVPLERVVGGRFEREARAAARLSHPGIVTLYEAGADDEGAYLVSASLVQGPDARQRCSNRGACPTATSSRSGSALCDALAHAHANGVRPSRREAVERAHPGAPGRPRRIPP